MQNLTGKVAVTGVASGISLECARIMHEAGASVVLVDHAADRLSALSAELGVEHVVVDLLDKASVATMMPAILDKMGQLDIIHANAGAWDRKLNLDINAVFRTVHAVLPHMVERGSGDIVVTSSVAGLMPVEPIYTASKHAMRPREVVEAVPFILTRPRNVRVRDLVILPQSLGL